MRNFFVLFENVKLFKKEREKKFNLIVIGWIGDKVVYLVDKCCFFESVKNRCLIVILSIRKEMVCSVLFFREERM